MTVSKRKPQVGPTCRGGVAREWRKGLGHWFRKWDCGCSELHHGGHMRLKWCDLHAPAPETLFAGVR